MLADFSILLESVMLTQPTIEAHPADLEELRSLASVVSRATL